MFQILTINMIASLPLMSAVHENLLLYRKTAQLTIPQVTQSALFECQHNQDQGGMDNWNTAYAEWVLL